MVATTAAVASEEGDCKRSNSSSGYMSEKITAQIQNHKDSEILMNMDWDLVGLLILQKIFFAK